MTLYSQYRKIHELDVVVLSVLGLPRGHQTPHIIKGLQIQMAFLFFIPMKQAPQDELKPPSLK